MSVVKRIKEYIDFKGVTNQKFEIEIGYSNGAFGSQLKNNKSIGSDKLENILTTYSDLDGNWLLTGKGSMLKSDNAPVIPGTSEVDHLYKELAASRLETIEGLRFKVAALEQTISELRYTRPEPSIYSNVAEPASQLTVKKDK
jgi:hypothetical protein